VALSLTMAARSGVSWRCMCSRMQSSTNTRSMVAWALASASLKRVFWNSNTVWPKALRSRV